MPTYEYRCPDGHIFDRFYRKISDAVAEVACPDCGKPATRQLSAGAGLLFKGSGFYLTDYGKNAHRGDSAAKSAKTDSSNGDGKSETKSTEAKPAEASSKNTNAGDSKPAGPATSSTSSSGSSEKK